MYKTCSIPRLAILNRSSIMQINSPWNKKDTWLKHYLQTGRIPSWIPWTLMRCCHQSLEQVSSLAEETATQGKWVQKPWGASIKFVPFYVFIGYILNQLWNTSLWYRGTCSVNSYDSSVGLLRYNNPRLLLTTRRSHCITFATWCAEYKVISSWGKLQFVVTFDIDYFNWAIELFVQTTGQDCYTQVLAYWSLYSIYGPSPLPIIFFSIFMPKESQYWSNSFLYFKMRNSVLRSRRYIRLSTFIWNQFYLPNILPGC